MTPNLLTGNDALCSLVAGNVPQAIRSLVAREDFAGALIVAAAHAAGRFVVRRPFQPPAEEEDEKMRADSHGQHEDNPKRILAAIACLIAENKLAAGHPIAAAAFLLGAGCMQEALYALVRGNELEVAYGLARSYASMNSSASDAAVALLPLLALKARDLGDHRLAVALMHRAQSQLPARRDRRGILLCVDAELLCASVASHPRCTDAEAESIYSKVGLPFGTRADEGRVTSAREEENAGTDSKWRAARLYILARRHDEALNVLLGPEGALHDLAERWEAWRGMSFGETRVPQPAIEPPVSFFTAVSLMHSIEPRQLRHRDSVNDFIAWTCWLGGWLAESQSTAWVQGLNFGSMTAPLYRTCRKLWKDVSTPCRYISIHKLMLAEAGALLHSCSSDAGTSRRAQDLLRQVIEDHERSAEGDRVSKEKLEYAKAVESGAVAFQRLSKWQSEEKATGISDMTGLSQLADTMQGGAAPIGAASVCATDHGPDAAPISILDGSYIVGAAHVLHDGSSCMGIADAVMWNYVNPFSPLADGSRVFAEG